MIISIKYNCQSSVFTAEKGKIIKPTANLGTDVSLVRVVENPECPCLLM